MAGKSSLPTRFPHVMIPECLAAVVAMREALPPHQAGMTHNLLRADWRVSITPGGTRNRVLWCSKERTDRKFTFHSLPAHEPAAIRHHLREEAAADDKRETASYGMLLRWSLLQHDPAFSLLRWIPDLGRVRVCGVHMRGIWDAGNRRLSAKGGDKLPAEVLQN